MTKQVDWRSIELPGGPEQQVEYEWLEDLCKEYCKKENHNPTAIEIGSWKGRTTALLAQFFYVFAIDTWDVVHFGAPKCGRGQSPVWNAFQQNMGRLDIYTDDRLCVICGDSSVLPRMGSLDAGMCFIDGDHSAEWCFRDARRCLAHLANDGLLVFHDWCRISPDPFWDGVRQAVDKFIEKYPDYEIKDSRPGVCAVGRRK